MPTLSPGELVILASSSSLSRRGDSRDTSTATATLPPSRFPDIFTRFRRRPIGYFRPRVPRSRSLHSSRDYALGLYSYPSSFSLLLRIVGFPRQGRETRNVQKGKEKGTVAFIVPLYSKDFSPRVNGSREDDLLLLLFWSVRKGVAQGLVDTSFLGGLTICHSGALWSRTPKIPRPGISILLIHIYIYAWSASWGRRGRKRERGAIRRRTLLPSFRTDFSLIYALPGPGPKKNESRRTMRQGQPRERNHGNVVLYFGVRRYPCLGNKGRRG